MVHGQSMDTAMQALNNPKYLLVRTPEMNEQSILIIHQDAA